MIVVDAAAVPDRPSGERTRLRGLYGAYARLDGAPPVTVFVARGSRLFDGVECSSSVLRLTEVLGGTASEAARRSCCASVAFLLHRAVFSAVVSFSAC